MPPLEQVRERVWSLPVPLPGHQRGLAYTLAVLLLDSDGRMHVVDPGWDTDQNAALLRVAIAEVAPGAPIASSIVSHLHPDHLGLAERLRRETGARLVLHELEAQAMSGPDVDLAAWGVPAERIAELAEVPRVVPAAVTADELVRGSGGPLDVPGMRIEALHTPGHTRGSMCLRLPDLGLLLTGDHVLPAIFPGIGLGGASPANPIADYLASLDRVSGFDDHEVLPGHGYRFRGLAERCVELAEHHRRRTREVAAALSRHPDASVWHLAATLTWSAGWANLRGLYLASALAQTAMHRDLVRGGAAA